MGNARLGPVVLAALLALLVTGCGDDPDATTVPEEEETMSETSSPDGSGEDEQPAPVDEAVADLAQRLDLAEEDVEVLEAEAVTWKDGSLGCPEPGRTYTQALVDGHKIVLRADDRTWPYHSGGGRGPFLCENLRPSIPPEPQDSDGDA